MTGFFAPAFPRRLRRERVFDFSFSMAGVSCYGCCWRSGLVLIGRYMFPNPAPQRCISHVGSVPQKHRRNILQ